MSTKPKYQPREMMERAVKVMRESIAESRDDGKKSPAVGAVLVKADGGVDTAFRGELRQGDHAEFALLERKNRSNRLDDCVLFVTLEPCAPGARKHPKLSCAERIVLARIKKVWVGIQDPDPLVDRKGIKYLQENGVKVEMFDRDLQEQINEANKEFIAQALERKAEAEKQAKPVVLSALENAVSTADMQDFSSNALNQYRVTRKIRDAITSRGFQRRLLQQGLLKAKGSKLTPSGFGLLLFGKSPRDVMPQSGLLGTIHYPDSRIETHDFDGPLLEVPGEVETWLKSKLPNTIDRSQMRRVEQPELPFELIREGIVNALVHRNYEIMGAKCQLAVTADTVVVKSPGAPVEPITLAQLQSFDAPMLSRNPVLHYVFAQMELAEERGLGLKSLKSKAELLNLPLPKYSWEAPYLVLTLYRNADSAVKSLSNTLARALTKEEYDGWAYLSRQTDTTQREYANHMRVTPRTAQRHLTHFVELRLLRRIGRGPATRYQVIRS